MCLIPDLASFGYMPVSGIADLKSDLFLVEKKKKETHLLLVELKLVQPL